MMCAGTFTAFSLGFFHFFYRHIDQFPHELISIIVGQAIAAIEGPHSDSPHRLLSGDPWSANAPSSLPNLSPTLPAQPVSDGVLCVPELRATGVVGPGTAGPQQPQPPPISRLDMAAVRSVCSSWRQLADQQVSYW